jgi:hypothetical protein
MAYLIREIFMAYDMEDTQGCENKCPCQNVYT